MIKLKYIPSLIERVNATASMSEAVRLKVGVLFLRDNRIIVDGFNGTAPGENNCCETEDCSATLDTVIHAEMNAVLYSSRKGISLEGTDVIITHSPCINCAKVLFGVGVASVSYINEFRTTDGLDYLVKRGIPCMNLTYGDEWIWGMIRANNHPISY